MRRTGRSSRRRRQPAARAALRLIGDPRPHFGNGKLGITIASLRCGSESQWWPAVTTDSPSDCVDGPRGYVAHLLASSSRSRRSRSCTSCSAVCCQDVALERPKAGVFAARAA